MWLLVVYILNVLWRIDRNCNWSGFGQNFSVCQLTSIFVAILLCFLVELGSRGTLDRA